MESMSTFRHDMGFFARQPEAKAQGLKANGALCFVADGVVTRDYGEGGGMHGWGGIGLVGRV